MHHVVYFEPDYDPSLPNLWLLRGQYKYPSVLGRLGERARITLLMGRLPPRSDPLRHALEAGYGVEFRRIYLPDVPGEYYSQLAFTSLTDALRRLRPTVLSNLNGRAIKHCDLAARAALSLGIRYVMRVGGDDLATKHAVFAQEGRAFDGTSVYGDLMRQERISLDCADAVVAMSERERRRLAVLTWAPDKIRVCYRGVDMAFFRADQPRKGVARRVLFIGRQSAEKGFDLAESAALLLREQGSEVTFTFAGTFAKRRVQNCEYRGYVDFADLPALYAEHDLVLVCSRTEGFPQVLMEAGAMGLPCVASRHLFQHDFVDRETALLCETKPADIARCVRALCDDQNFYEQLSARSLAHARACFDETVQHLRYQQILLGRDAA